MITRRHLLASVAPVALAANLKPRLRPALCAYSFREELKSGKLKYEDLIRIAAENDLDGVDMTVYWFPNTENSFLRSIPSPSAVSSPSPPVRRATSRRRI